MGIDEVGRGALAGPITLGAVCFDKSKNQFLKTFGINDSKKLSPKKRQYLTKVIKKNCLAYSISCVSHLYINNHGIVKAEEKAIRQVVKSMRSKLSYKKIYILLDAYTVKYLHGIGLKNQKGIIHGDELSTSIAAASIIAKCHRDDLMINLSRKYRRYRWNKNKGYGTRDHIKALKKYGRTRFHRDVFIRKMI